MTTKTETEQLRAEFEAWAASIGFCVTGKYAETVDVLCAESAFKAGYKAALQSQDQKDAERYRWLRAGGNDDIGVVRGFDGIDYGSTSVAYTYEEGLDGEKLDEAIDHARRVEGDK